MDTDFSSRIKQVRVEKNLSQAKYAEKLNVSVPTICRLEKGDRSPGADLLIRIADTFGYDLVWLMTGEQQVGVDSTESNKRQLMLQLKRDPAFRAEVLNELGLRSPTEVVRNSRIYNLLQEHKVDWMRIVELTKQSVATASDAEHKLVMADIEKYLKNIAYVNVLLEVGRDQS